MTQKTRNFLLDQITEYALTNPSQEKMGEMVLFLLKKNNYLSYYQNKKNPSLSKTDMEVIRAYKCGWQFYTVDGAIWYWINNDCDGGGPWAEYSKKGQNLRMVSRRTINKLIDCGEFPINYRFR